MWTRPGAATPLRRPCSRDVAADLKLELDKLGNWSAQTPSDGEAYVTLNKVDPGEDVLAHPRSPLSFRQKLIPLGKRLDKIGVAKPKDADSAIQDLTYADNPVTLLRRRLPIISRRRSSSSFRK
jgi:hypothetical protein